MRRHPRSRTLLPWALLALLALGAAPRNASKSVVLTAMEQELERTWKEVKRDPQAPLYFLGYTITETRGETISASRGALLQENEDRSRTLDVTARVGTPELDSTHEIRSSEGGRGGFGGSASIPLDDDPGAIRAAIWEATDARIKAAQERFIRVQTDRALRVAEERPAPDFSREEPQVQIGALPSLEWDRSAWRERVRDLSRRFDRYPAILGASLTLSAETTHTFQANSEGTRLQFGRTHARLSVFLNGVSSDGMRLQRQESFDARAFSGLPKDDVILATVDKLAKELQTLREAPLVEPFTGPAILRNRASAVFFHEIFGHRIEGHRQKLSDEGQTFSARVGEAILPSFLSVVDDPSLPSFAGRDLNGHYGFDDEGVPSRRVTLVENGVLKEFLLARSPLPGFPRSNGHGRRQPGREVVARQGNLMVLSSQPVPYTRLHQMLVEECRRQKRPYGLIFDDIAGGFTMTGRSGPQAFKVLPLLVTRVYADGRPDEMVRGVDIVGTPLTSFAKIVATGDDPAVFNGYCGAESGFIPVSACSPSILVSELEIEKQGKGTDRPPLLPAPPAEPSQQSAQAPKRLVPDDDPTLKAMADELERTRSQLKMDTFVPPYFVAYTAQDGESVVVSAAMGALLGSDRARGRQLWADVRVGDASLDSTNFRSRGPGQPGADRLPVEVDYATTRRVLWLASDEAYKGAIGTLARKRAALQNQAGETRPPDLGDATPATVLESALPLDVDRSAWEKRARAVSAAFRAYPVLEDGRMTLRAEQETQRFLNSQGAFHRRVTTLMEITLRATARTADGTPMSDSRRFHARRSADLPSQEALIAAANDLAKSVTALAAAPKTEEYAGPVLFTGEAAATFFDRLLADKLSDPAMPVSEEARGGGQARGDKLTGPLGRRILPAGFRVVDDPTMPRLESLPLLGGYAVDDDGVPAAPVTLVEDGLLRAFYMSRIPTAEIPGSNGHGRRTMMGRVTGQPANLIVTAANGVADLKAQLMTLCREENLPYGLIVERFETAGRGPGGFQGGRRGRGPGGRGQGFGQPAEERSDLPDPVGFRKVYADGREEVVRGGRLAGVNARTLRAIAAAGTDRHAATRRLAGAGPNAVTVVAPSVLVTGMDVRPAEAGGEKPPLIARPSLATR